MANDGVIVKVDGLPELKARLAQVTKALRRRVLRDALAAGMREVQSTAKRAAPVLSSANRLKAKFRKPRTVRNAIKVRTSRIARQRGDVGVFVNVKPLPGAKYKKNWVTTKSGQRIVGGYTKVKPSQRTDKNNPRDPFYWRWLEFGSKKMRARPFLQKGADRLPDAYRVFSERMANWVRSIDQGGPIR